MKNRLKISFRVSATLSLLIVTSICIPTNSFIVPAKPVINPECHKRPITSRGATVNGKSNDAPLQQDASSDTDVPLTLSTTPLQMQSSISPPPKSANTQDARLLCACQCAYEISNPYFRAASYRPSTTAKRISRGVNSVLVGQTTDNSITIAFRGTQSSSPLDWLQNAALFLSEVDEFRKMDRDDDSKSRIKVHTGFYRAVKSLWKPLKSVLSEMLEEMKEDNKTLGSIIDSDVNVTEGGATASATVQAGTDQVVEEDIVDGTIDVEEDKSVNIYLTGHSKVSNTF